MPAVYLYRIPLYEAYTYSLVEEGRPHPDDLDEEGTLDQVITMDEEGRIVKAERFVDGKPSMERTVQYEGGRPIREEEFYHDTESGSEIRYHYRPDGYTKEYFTDGVLDRSEVFTVNERGVTVACRQLEAGGVEYGSWEADENGNRLFIRDGEREVRCEHRFDRDGRIIETVSRDGEHFIRETFEYEHGVLVKHEVFSREDDDDVSDDAFISSSEPAETLVGEMTVESDPDGRWEIRRRRRLLAADSRLGLGGGKYWPSRVEILFDERKRITDILTCDEEYVDPLLGINCEPNAYYFLEYED